MASSSVVSDMGLRRARCSVTANAACFVNRETLSTSSGTNAKAYLMRDLLASLQSLLQKPKPMNLHKQNDFVKQLARHINSMMFLVDSERDGFFVSWKTTFTQMVPALLRYREHKEVMAPTFYLLGFVTGGAYLDTYLNQQTMLALLDHDRLKSLIFAHETPEVRVLSIHILSNVICCGPSYRPYIKDAITSLGVNLLDRMLVCVDNSDLEGEWKQYVRMFSCLLTYGDDEELIMLYGCHRNDQYNGAAVKFLALSVEKKSGSEVLPVIDCVHSDLSRTGTTWCSDIVSLMEKFGAYKKIVDIVNDRNLKIDEIKRAFLQRHFFKKPVKTA